MAQPTHIIKGARGPGLDFRTKPEQGSPTPPPAAASDPMVQRLTDATKEIFGSTTEPGAPAEPQKKNPEGQQSRAGTTPNASPASRSGAAIEPGTVDLEPGAGEDDPGAGGGNGSPNQKGTTDDSGGDGEAGNTTDPLALLAKGLPTEEPAKPQPETDKAKDGKPSGGALRATLEKTLAEKRALESKIAELEKREDPRVKDITTAWETEKKAREDAEAKVAQLDYSESREFKERFVEPYNAAFKDTLAQLRALPSRTAPN